MFPGFFEWVWDAGHMLFMGGTYYALFFIGSGLTYCIVKSVFDTMQGKGPHDEEEHH